MGICKSLLYTTSSVFTTFDFFKWEKQVEKLQFSDLPKDQGLNPIPKQLLQVNWFSDFGNENERLPRGRKKQFKAHPYYWNIKKKNLFAVRHYWSITRKTLYIRRLN